MKKLINLIALVMLVSTNVLTPFSYAQVEIPEVIPENEVGNVEEIRETREKDNEITGEIQNSLGEVEGEGSLPLIREVVNETSPAKQGENLEGLKEEVEDSLDDVESPASDEDKKEDTEKVEIDEVAQQEEENTKIEKQEENLEDNNEITEQENVEAEIQELQKIQEISTMDTATNSKDIVLQATSTVANQILKISKYFGNAYTVDWGDGSPIETVSADKSHTYSTEGTYTITLSTTADRWTFRNVYSALVPKAGTTMSGIKVTYMPSLADGFGTNAKNPGHYFFQGFNEYGAIESLPEGSFDTSNIEKAGVGFFSYFNKEGKLKNLPDESFDISNITSTQIGFFAHFNIKGELESLPDGSFDTSNIVSVGDYFFGYFNNEGAIESLPEGSFKFSTGLTIVGNDFFYAFNLRGAIESLPEGSFDTSHITSVGNSFFDRFNYEGALKTLPEGSFKFSTGLTTVGNDFFYAFNLRGAIESLPEGSFDTSHITSVGNSFFDRFNYEGALKTLPDGSVNLSKITTVGNDFFTAFNYSGALERLGENSFKLSTGTTTVGDYFFYAFNQYGKNLTGLSVGSFDTSHIISVGTGLFKQFNMEGGLTSLPENSFKLSTGLTTVGNEFFRGFNYEGALKTLPDWSFDTSNITSVGERFFNLFNYNGVLESLPNGSFDTSNIISVKSGFFWYFNGRGAIESLPDGSFQLSTGLAAVGDNFFRSFNYNGALESLPEGSFDTSNITSVGERFFQSFNIGGAIEALPEGSFDTSNITSAGDMFFYYFNENGSITYLPDSFTMNSVRSSSSGYDSSFNSTGHTINRKVSDLVRGLDVPETDMDTFSDNQPGRCGVHENWLVSKADACHIIYDANEGEGTTTGGYESDATIVEVGSGITLPTREGCTFSGWQDASGNNIEEVIFPDMDGQIIYAQWTPNEYSITFEDSSEENEKIVISGLYLSDTSSIKYPKWTKEGYKIVWDKEIPATMPAENMIIKASWEKNGYSGGGGGGGSSKKTEEDTHGSAEDSQKNTQDDKNTENVIQSETKGSEESINTPVDSSDKFSEGQEILSPSDRSFTKEQKDAYIFAKENGITTKDTIQSAQMNGKLTRIAMAKILSQYAINVLGQTPDTSETIKFRDVTSKKDADYDNGVTLAYQLGIMGQNMKNNKFRPDDEVTRAEFVTALSRLLYSTSDGEYKSTSKYYTPHMAKLYNEGIINNTDPSMKERRGYVMIMLMRSAK